MSEGPRKNKISLIWSTPPSGVNKFNVYGAVRGKPGPTLIEGILRDSTLHRSCFFLSL